MAFYTERKGLGGPSRLRLSVTPQFGQADVNLNPDMKYERYAQASNPETLADVVPSSVPLDEPPMELGENDIAGALGISKPKMNFGTAVGDFFSGLASGLRGVDFLGTRMAQRQKQADEYNKLMNDPNVRIAREEAERVLRTPDEIGAGFTPGDVFRQALARQLANEQLPDSNLGLVVRMNRGGPDSMEEIANAITQLGDSSLGGSDWYKEEMLRLRRMAEARAAALQDYNMADDVTETIKPVERTDPVTGEKIVVHEKTVTKKSKQDPLKGDGKLTPEQFRELIENARKRK